MRSEGEKTGWGRAGLLPLLPLLPLLIWGTVDGRGTHLPSPQSSIKITGLYPP